MRSCAVGYDKADAQERRTELGSRSSMPGRPRGDAASARLRPDPGETAPRRSDTLLLTTCEHDLKSPSAGRPEIDAASGTNLAAAPLCLRLSVGTNRLE